MKLTKSETKVFCCSVYLLGSASMSLFAYMQYGSDDIQIHSFLDSLKLIILPLILGTCSLILTLLKSHKFGRFLGIGWAIFEVFVFIVNVVELIYKAQKFEFFLFMYYIVRMSMGVTIATYEQNQYQQMKDDFAEKGGLLGEGKQKFFYFGFFQFLAIVVSVFVSDYALFVTFMSFQEFFVRQVGFYFFLVGNVTLVFSLIYNKSMGRIVGSFIQLGALILIIVLYAKVGIPGFLWLYIVIGFGSLGLAWINIYYAKKDTEGLSVTQYYNGYIV
ncbi:hypothetical protein PPERSA_09398 [Pseudocohnilembus persalinus]|uniref:Uncharacterized protein n=1 Tax=Pseudocohnilembus persalinus TaxID=266149 RepID=A0A0V0R5F1_PSEPJ|nr:hypothetical protein PPERSA_09398 [Pseudocohnilembus persalinus]|eukprot:KRX09568.1 hypothetical protein PPERSA_09398 [Pseudocohnilembus persalinus]